MALRNIRKQPDPVLRQEAVSVNRFNERLHRLLDDMVETMLEAEGVGLAAPQVGISKRVVVIKNEDKILELINPEIIESAGEIVDIEGCLSFPGLYAEVPRFASVKVKGKDRCGKDFMLSAEGFLARVLQHEIDHLHGILFIDRALRFLSPEEINSAQKKG